MSSSPDSGDQTRFGQSLNPHIIDNLVERRHVRSDGSQPKKRGPKPDSKPALTRRQELNRQAQRTHRERKELYIKALEDEVLRLKEIYSSVSQDKEQLAEENQRLRELLNQHGLPLSGLPGPSGPPRDGSSNPDYSSSRHPSNPASDSFQFHEGGGSSSGFSPDFASQSSGPTFSPTGRQTTPVGGDQLQQLTQQALQKNKGIDYEQAGIDFVLTLEQPCMTHLPYMMQVASEQAGRTCGHALMATCPPQPFNALPSDGIFSHAHTHNQSQCSMTDQTEGQQTWTLSKSDLSTLLDLSAGLNLGSDSGELTPITAWSLLMSHPRLSELELDDIQAISGILRSKIRCYGFGAVTENFEVQDAIENALTSKSMHPTLLMV